MSSNFLATIEKLKGRDNYASWKFVIKTYLEHEGLWKSVEGTEENASKISKCRTTLILAIDPTNFIHVQEAETAKEVWDKLQTVFEDKGRVRRIGLIRQLSQTKLDECESMQVYVNTIVTAAQRLNAIGFKVDDEWLACFLLGGLSEKYRPMVMALDSVEIQLSSDAVKTKLLQEIPSDSKNSAFFNNAKQKQKKGGIRCYTCNKKGHKSPDCPDKNKLKRDSKRKPDSAYNMKPEYSSVFLTGQFNKYDWYVDSGATQHLTMNSDWIFNEKKSTISEILAANDTRMKVESCGTVKLYADINGTPNPIEVRDVLCVPNLTANLLSVSQLTKNNNYVDFNANGCNIKNKFGKLMATANLVDGLYRLNGARCKSYVAVSKSEKIETWHRRLGHININDLLKMKKGTVNGVSFNEEKLTDVCVTCLQGKQARFPFKHAATRANEILELVHADLAGPTPTKSIGGSRYYFVLVDDHSRMTFTYFLKTKDEAFEKFCEFKAYVENQTGKKLKKFRSDNGTEFCNRRFDNLFNVCGIERQTSTPYTPQQNGLAERTIRTLTERALCMFTDANLGKKFWAEAVATATYIKNHSSSRVLEDKSPIEVWSGFKPDLSHFRIFGSPAMIHVPDENRKKFEVKSVEHIFVGYCNGNKGYRLINPATNKVVESRDVIFLESEKISYPVMPLKKSNESSDNGCIVVELGDSDSSDEYCDAVEVPPFQEDQIGEEIISPNEMVTSDPVQINNSNETSTLRRSTRIKNAINRQDVQYFVQDNVNEPSSFSEAISSLNSENWRSAMNEEFQSLLGNKTWQLVDLPTDRRAINSKWVFKIKTDTNGKILRYKARLVAKGCSQRAGIDYEETFSPVVRYSSIRLMMALAARYDLDIEQMDAITAFLQGDVNETIYMNQPEGFDDGSGRVCQLKKAIYGLKQASRQWNIKLNDVMIKSGYKCSQIDSCIYFRRQGRSMIFVAVYVDDFLIFSNNKGWTNQLKANLTKNFSMKDLGEASNCIGMRINRDKKQGTITLDQKKYTEQIIDKFNMNDCYPVKNPVDSNQKLTKDMTANTSDETKEMQNIPYQEAVGSLLYLSVCTRPDISFAVGNVSRFNNEFGKGHWNAVKRIFKYLKGTTDYKLQFSRDGNQYMIGFSDADWASDIESRKSCTGYLFKIQGGAISWTSKRQPTVALSSAEAEYMALSSATQEAIWLKQLLQEIGENIDSVEIHCDNKSAINIAHNQLYSPRTKHIDIRHHFIKEKIRDGLVKIKYLNTENMVADSLTKGVTNDKHNFCLENMGLTL